MRTFRTPKGTDLPLLNLRGKEYLEVKFRLVWFREERPEWRIQTEIISHNNDQSLVCAKILDVGGNVMAMAHKQEDKKGFGDHLEKAETGAIGRALALLGFGTQFCADELDEGERIVDAPTQAPPPPSSVQNLLNKTVSPQTKQSPKKIEAGDYVIELGKKYKGTKLKDVPADDLANFIDWLKNEAPDEVKNSHKAQMLKVQYERFTKEA